ncbi:RrF2 family transcriptional regulator [Scatolibacter rhodanostii]|uniref:RrF2 family transcriptional regulator n=1 Tax=Scatolibacter rhodanostii TaxID=2014781 RepID=UPI000C085216|nr:Rrf2 family transcriptional regulator [Scatolibacter rhodanostii]
MKISTKGRYALASAIIMARHYDGQKYITLTSIADELGLSKIYMEHVFSLLRRENVVLAVKGAGGGYRLAYPPSQLTVFEILFAAENSMFGPTEETVSQTAGNIESVMQKYVFDYLDDNIHSILRQITLENLLSQADKKEESF